MDLNKSSSVRQPDWSSWVWHMTNSIRTVEQLKQWVDITQEEEEAIKACEGKYKWSITPYYASLMDKSDQSCPVRLQAIPSLREFQNIQWSEVDPVGDRENLKTQRVIHKYPDRIVMLVTDVCPVYCRHCTRKYHTTDLSGTYFGNSDTFSRESDLGYIRSHPEIRDVLLTGGDPLILSDKRLEQIISDLRSIDHIEIIRIGSRFPVLLPQRITKELCEMLEKYHPIYLNTHFNHPKEITAQAAEACDRLLRHGIPVQNQSVLLSGINDDLQTMKKLCTELVRIRVIPYYLYHCDNVVGASHFMTSIEKGRQIMRGLIGYTTGFAVPRYIVTTRIGKIPLSEDHVSYKENCVSLVNYQGKEITIKECEAEEPN